MTPDTDRWKPPVWNPIPRIPPIPGFYLKCGVHFMSVHDHNTQGRDSVDLASGEMRFETELDALRARDRCLAKVWKCPRLVVVEIGECEVCEKHGPLTHVGNRVLCEKCAEPDENACEACRHQDGTHYEGKRWTCDACVASPEDIQDGD